MNPYSHLVVASKLKPFVKPEDPKEYYWGAVVPDIRYLADIQREQTHLSLERIQELFCLYPQLKSFIQGYLVHCLSDEIDLRTLFVHHFPFYLLRRKLYHQRIAVLLELFYFEHEKLDIKVSGAHNEVLEELGLHESTSRKFSQFINQYIASSSYEARILELSGLLGLENNSRIKKYMKAANTFQKNWLLKSGLFLGLRIGRISDEIVSKVIFLLSAMTSREDER